MPDILIRGLDGAALRRLKARARRHGRSLQSEARLLLEQAAGAGGRQVAEMFDRWKVRFAGRKFTPSQRLLREDRGR